MSLRNILSKREEIIAAPKSDKKCSRVGKDAMVEDVMIFVMIFVMTFVMIFFQLNSAPALAHDLGEQAAAFALGDPDPKCSILIKFQVC